MKMKAPQNKARMRVKSLIAVMTAVCSLRQDMVQGYVMCSMNLDAVHTSLYAQFGAVKITGQQIF